MTLEEGVTKIEEKVINWNEKGSIYTLTVNAARKLSKDPIFNLAVWMKYCYGPLYTGENEEDWVQSAKDAVRILR